VLRGVRIRVVKFGVIFDRRLLRDGGLGARKSGVFSVSALHVVALPFLGSCLSVLIWVDRAGSNPTFEGLRGCASFSGILNFLLSPQRLV